MTIITTSQYKERRAALVAALRSGKYEQGRFALSTLHDDGTDTHCCLGVACQVAMQNGVPLIASDEFDPGTLMYLDDGSAENLHLLPTVQAWYGFRDEVGTFYRPDSSTPDTLANVNDQPGSTFDEIAKIIETNDTLFTWTKE